MEQPRCKTFVEQLALVAAALLLAGCGALRPPGSDSPPVAAVPPPVASTAPATPPAAAPAETAPRPQPRKTPDEPTVETGIASWYGKPFHGRRTANGEIYDMHAMTAAHKTMPLPSYARVRNPANGREIVVRVNDRGPFKPGRIIDLSRAAARALGIDGLASVQVTRLGDEAGRSGASRKPEAAEKGQTLADARR
jgi:rare lipoprotein A